jgi:tryptophanyl-tRNA synthetase
VDCKKNCAKKIAVYFQAHRDKRAYYEKNPKIVKEILMNGIKRARKEAHNTMSIVYNAMKIGEKWPTK